MEDPLSKRGQIDSAQDSLQSENLFLWFVFIKSFLVEDTEKRWVAEFVHRVIFRLRLMSIQSLKGGQATYFHKI